MIRRLVDTRAEGEHTLGKSFDQVDLGPVRLSLTKHMGRSMFLQHLARGVDFTADISEGSETRNRDTLQKEA